MSVPYAAFPKYGASVLGQAKYDAELAAWQAYQDSVKHRRPEGEEQHDQGSDPENLDKYTYLRKYVMEGQTRKRIFREQNIRAATADDALKQGRDAMTTELGDSVDEFGERQWTSVPATEKAVKPRGKAFEEGDDERRNEEGHNGSDTEGDEGQGEGRGDGGSDDDAEGEDEGDDDGQEQENESDAEGDGDGEGQDDDDTPKMPTCPDCGEQRGTTEGCCKVEPPEDMPMPEDAVPEEPNLQLLRIDGEAPYAGPAAHHKIVKISHEETVETLTKSLADVDQWTRSVVGHATQQVTTELYGALTESHKALKNRIAKISKGGYGGADGATREQLAKVRKDVQLLVKSAFQATDNVDEIVKKVLKKIDAPVRIEVSVNGQVNEIDGITHKVFPKALKCMELGMPLMLVGPAGSGKGFLAQHLADGLGLRFGFSSCSEGMTEGMLLGRGVPLATEFLYLQSEFVDYYENGGVFLLDEIDGANPNVILILNECLSSPHLSIPNRVAKPYAKRHKDFHFVCAANTWGTGPNMEYVGRNRLDGSFLNRFIGSTIELDYDNRVEGEIAKSYLGADDAKKTLTRFWGIRKKLTEMNIRRIWSTRGLQKMCLALNGGDDMATVLDAHTQGWTQDEKNKAGV